MELKVDGDVWGWKQRLRGRVNGVISVPVQVSSPDTRILPGSQPMHRNNLYFLSYQHLNHRRNNR